MPKKKLPQKRGVKGEGGVYPDTRRGGYFGKVPVGRYQNGRTRYTEVRGKTQAEVVEKKKMVAPPDPNAVTVKEWAARWIAGLSNRSSTKALYAQSVNSRVVPALGHLKLKDVTVSRVKAAAAAWTDIKPQTVNLILDRATTMFAAAILDELLTTNPFALCPRFEFTPKPIDPFTPSELRQLIDARDACGCGPLFAFLAATGCRVGEASALDVTDYDAVTGEIHITKTYDGTHGIGPPKSKHSRRTLVAPQVIRPVIEGAVAGRTSGVMFARPDGKRIYYEKLRVRFAKLLTELGLRVRVMHAMRHGVATALVAAHVPIADVAKWLGDSVATVIKTYLHPSGADVSAALGKILSSAAT